MQPTLFANANKNTAEISELGKALNISVLIPCLKKSTHGRGVRDFQFALPQDTIYVYDNNSTDRTASIATKAGAIVRHELFQGKGNVVRRMFSDVEAEIYVLVDGNDTYDAAVAPELIDLCDASST